jgi:hypothetical protein
VEKMMGEIFDVGVREGMEKVATKGWEKWVNKIKVPGKKWRHFKNADDAIKHMGGEVADEAFGRGGKAWRTRVPDLPEGGAGDTALAMGMNLATQGLGAGVGHHYGGEQKKRGEKYHFGVGQALGALLLPGGAGYQVGRYMAHKDKKTDKSSAKREK